MENLSAETIRRIKRDQKLYKKLRWTNLEEAVGVGKSSLRNPKLATRKVTTKIAFSYLLRRSVFGEYFQSFNYQHQQNKFLNDNKFGITRHELKGLKERQLIKFEKRNNLCDDLWEMLITCLTRSDVVDFDGIKDVFTALRIAHSYINTFDKFLLNFKNLQILVLCGNWIGDDIFGAWLPRKLKFLELFDNEIACLTNLAKNPPKGIKHLGLGRNKLLDKSGLQLLADRKLFPRLTSLDLSDNDICDFNRLLDALQPLQQLDFLSLEGNPIYVLPNYKDEIVKTFPKLLYLDGTEILKDDRIPPTTDNATITPGITFKCFRIIGLPPPKRENKFLQTIHVEVKLPLLEELRLLSEDVDDDEQEEEEVVILEEKQIEAITGDQLEEAEKKDESAEINNRNTTNLSKTKQKKDKNNKKEKKGGKATKEKKSGMTPYERPNEISKKPNYSFATERKTWEKILEFPEIIIEAPENDLVLLRNTLRTCVDVKVVYLEWLTPEMQKVVEKKGGKAKPKAEKKDKKGKKPKKIESEQIVVEAPPIIEETLTEKILKRVTLASFKCELYNVNWSDQSADFYWANHQEVGNSAIPVIGSLKDINYDSDIKEADSKEKDKNKKAAPSEEVELVLENLEPDPFARQRLPNIFTCQVGFGLIRSAPSVVQIQSTDTTNILGNT